MFKFQCSNSPLEDAVVSEYCRVSWKWNYCVCRTDHIQSVVRAWPPENLNFASPSRSASGLPETLSSFLMSSVGKNPTTPKLDGSNAASNTWHLFLNVWVLSTQLSSSEPKKNTFRCQNYSKICKRTRHKKLFSGEMPRWSYKVPSSICKWDGDDSACQCVENKHNFSFQTNILTSTHS